MHHRYLAVSLGVPGNTQVNAGVGFRSATDLHEIILGTSAPTPLVVADHVIDPESDSPPGRPAGPAPKRSSDQRPAELTGAGSPGCLQPGD